MKLVYWGAVNAATDVTMSANVDASGSQTRASIIALISPIAAGIISSDPSVAAAAAAAVNTALQSANVALGYPQTPVTYSGLPGVPMQWTYMQMNDTFGDAYSDTYLATWTNGGARRGDLAVLDPRGKLRESTMPESYPTLAQVEARIAAATEGIIPPGTVVPRSPDRPTSWWGRLLKQKRLTQPSALVFVGSSTSAISPGYIAPLVAALQVGQYPSGSPTAVQWSTSATFAPETAEGLHGYSAAEGGTTSSNYLDSSEMDKIAALSPACIVHMVGANDYTQQVNPATYETNMRAKLAYFDSVLTAPCQHVLVHPYAHRTFSPPSYAWSRYRDVLDRIAASRPNTAFVDLSPAYEALGVPGADPLAFILADSTHQTADGYAFMADLLLKFFTR